MRLFNKIIVHCARGRPSIGGFQDKPAMTVMVTPDDENAQRKQAFGFGSLDLWFFGSAFSDKIKYSMK
jgi:hypothetical protein